MMLDKLVGAQVVRINESSIEVKLGDKIHVLEIVVDEGDCCGFANFDMKLLYAEGDERNPIITNIEIESDSKDYEETAIMTFYGENKKIASIEAEAGSGSGWAYGACVTLRCKTLDIDETLVEW